METYTKNTKWNGLTAIEISNRTYQAIILPENGAQLITLKHIPSGIDLLRTPSDLEEMMEMPEAFGIPVLCFPNRIADGKFVFNNKQYTFPVNKEEENNHLHGFLHKRPWTIQSLNSSDNTAEAVLEFINTPGGDIYNMFPHEFSFRITYRLTEAGLEQNISVDNNGETPMPFGLGFHTAFNVPFGSNRNPADYRLQAPISKLWPRDQRNLPTGETKPLSETHQRIADGSCNPVTEDISGFFSADDRSENIATITDIKTGTSIVYEADRAYGFWILWNFEGNSGFVCPEPQTMMVNAPNLRQPEEQTGFLSIEPGKNWQAKCSIYLKGAE